MPLKIFRMGKHHASKMETPCLEDGVWHVSYHILNWFGLPYPAMCSTVYIEKPRSLASSPSTVPAQLRWVKAVHAAGLRGEGKGANAPPRCCARLYLHRHTARHLSHCERRSRAAALRLRPRRHQPARTPGLALYADTRYHAPGRVDRSGHQEGTPSAQRRE